MKSLKNYLPLLVAGIMLLLLTGCSENATEVIEDKVQQTAVYEGLLDGAQTKITIHHQDETMRTVEILASFKLTDLGLEEDATLSEEQQTALEEALASTFETYSDTAGVTLTNQFTDEAFEVNIELDMSQVDSSSFANLTGTTLPDSQVVSELAYDDFATSLKAAGFTEVE
ncbi:DUF1307 domain-containing protein [Enterococcus sp. HY326]|uniref:DUF1307 domain-containing protein n=1 Tax=Enterococcus sp. HY326 TaxID=2971265 RepID=UPI00223F6EBE|nr:DUF1307 domain-containing protein [Enterococcus sp. HY326]